jgi:type IV secretory pathway VirB6-like protein
MRATGILEVSVAAEVAGALVERFVNYLFDKRTRLLRTRNILRVLLVLLCVGTTVAFGQADTGSSQYQPQGQTTTPSAYTFNRDTIIQQISGKVSSELNGLAANSSLQGLGKYLTAFFLVALIVWSSVKTMASGKGFGELIGEWVPIFVSFGIVTLFLDQAAGNLIVSTMDGIASAIGDNSMSTLDGAVRATADPIFKAVAAVSDQPRVTAASSSEGFMASLLAGAVTGLMGLVAKVLTCFILILAGVLMIATTIMGFISVQLVLLLAPLMVPFLMFKPMSWMFDSWLKFLLGACMLKIVMAFLLKVASGLLTSMSGLALQHYAEAKGASPMETMQTDIVLLGMMLVFALLAMLLLMQAPSIATGLLSGGAGGTGFQGIKGLTQSVGSRVNSGVTGGVGSATGRFGAQSLRNAGAGLAGARHARAGQLKDMRYRNAEAKTAYDRAYRNNTKTPPAQP